MRCAETCKSVWLTSRCDPGQEFPSCRIPLDRLFQLVPRLAPRLYTICNSPHVSPSRIHAVVSVVQEVRRVCVGVVSWVSPVVSCNPVLASAEETGARQPCVPRRLLELHGEMPATIHCRRSPHRW